MLFISAILFLVGITATEEKKDEVFLNPNFKIYNNEEYPHKQNEKTNDDPANTSHTSNEQELEAPETEKKEIKIRSRKRSSRKRKSRSNRHKKHHVDREVTQKPVLEQNYTLPISKKQISLIDPEDEVDPSDLPEKMRNLDKQPPNLNSIQMSRSILLSPVPDHNLTKQLDITQKDQNEKESKINPQKSLTVEEKPLENKEKSSEIKEKPLEKNKEKPEKKDTKTVPLLPSSYQSPMSTSLFSKPETIDTVKKQIDEKIKEISELTGKLSELKKESEKAPEERIDYKIIEVTDNEK